MKLTKISETPTTITLGWEPVQGCEGYVFYRDGTRVSRTFDPTRDRVKFSKGTSYRVEAITFSVIAADSYPDAPAPMFKKVAPRVAYKDGGSDARYCFHNPDGSLRPGVVEVPDGFRDEVAGYDDNGLCRGGRSDGSSADCTTGARNIDGRPLCSLPMQGDPTKNTGSWLI